MKKFFTILLLFAGAQLFSQTGGVRIGPTPGPPAPSAALDISYTNKGFLMPRLTQQQQDAIEAPEAGLMVYNTTTSCFDFYTGTAWQPGMCACTAPPSAPGSIMGLSVYCAYQTNVRYTVTPVASTTAYVWTIPYDATFVSGQGTNSIVLNLGSVSDNITVYGINGCGTSGTSTLAISSVSSPPDNPTAISGVTYAANNQAGVTYGIAPAANTAFYNWTVPSGATIASGAGTNAITVNFGNTSGNICVTDSNGCGNSTTTCTAVSLSDICPTHGTVNFGYAAAVQTLVVPSCISSVTIDAYGAQGGTNTGYFDNEGGLGGHNQATFDVIPGSTLYIYVGNQPIGNAAGFNGGGPGAGIGTGGGGASDVRMGGNDLDSRIIVAGGGGGVPAQWSGTGGDGGGTDGLNPTGGAGGTGGGFNGQGATQSAGGAGESFYRQLGTAGGGGGGGYYGGGGGDAGPGGGGSGYVTATGSSNVTYTSGVQTGNGHVVITW